MTMTNSEVPYFLEISWADNGVDHSKVLDTRMAATLLRELELRKGIKAKFRFVE